MYPGRRNKRITVLKPPDLSNEENTDAMGQPVDQWETVTTLWGNVRDLTGARLSAAQQVHAELRTEVRFNYSSAAAKVAEAMRLQYTDKRGTRTLEIVGIPADPDGARRDLVCTCREVKP